MKKENLLKKIKKGATLSGLLLIIGSGIGFFETYSLPSKYPSIEENKKTVKSDYASGWWSLGIYAGLAAMYVGIRSEFPGIKKRKKENLEEEESSEKD